MVFCKYVAIFTWDGFIQMLEENVPALQSDGVRAFPVPLRSVWESHSWCVRKERHNRQLCWDEVGRGGPDSWNKWASWWTGQPAEWWLFLIGTYWPEAKPPTVCHISTKWITDKSAGADCFTDLTTSLRPRVSQVTFAWLWLNCGSIEKSLKMWPSKEGN